MNGAGKWLCPSCHGMVRSTGRADLATAIETHHRSCPNAPREVKR